MSGLISAGPVGSAAGLASGAAGLVKGLTSRATLMQFELNPDDGRITEGQSNLILAFDCVTGDTLTQQSQPTAYPIEDASSITDHITRLPLQIDLVGIVSDTPTGPSKALFAQEAVVAAASALLPPLGVVGGGIGAGLVDGVIHPTYGKDGQGGTNADRPSRKALELLQALQTGDPKTKAPPKPFTATSRLGRWTNMMIANMVVPRDAETGDCLVFQITLVQVNVVPAQQVPLANFADPTVAGAKRSLGAQSSKQTTEGSTEDGYAKKVNDTTRIGKDDAIDGLGTQNRSTYDQIFGPN